MLVDSGVVAGLWLDGDGPSFADAEILDASGTTLVPGMVDCHAHLTMQGGAHWIDRGSDDTETLLAVAEENAELMLRSGVRWARDLGSPTRLDPVDGRTRAVALGVRDRWRGNPRYPYIQAAGTWLTRAGTFPGSLVIGVDDGDQLLRAAADQLTLGADLVKLYLDGPGFTTPAFASWEVQRVADMAHGQGAKVAAHATVAGAVRVAVEGGVDSVEHGFHLEDDVAATMARNGTVLVSTLAMLHSMLSFGRTTSIRRYRKLRRVGEMLEAAESSVRSAQRAGVPLAAGTDFGGGSTRANQLAWEVQALVKAGVEPCAALAAVTWRGGDLLGDPAAGRLQVGGPAHFSLVHGDPLSDPESLWRVWLTA